MKKVLSKAFIAKTAKHAGENSVAAKALKKAENMHCPIFIYTSHTGNLEVKEARDV